MQIINDPSRASSLASSLGSGLNQLAELKLANLTKQYDQQIERSNFTKTWEPILGKQSAYFLSGLDPEQRQNAMQNIGSLLQLNEPDSSAEQVGGMRSLQQQQQPQQQNGMQQYDRGYFLKKMLGQSDQQDSLLSGLQGGQQQQMQQQPEQQVQGQPQINPDKAQLVADLFATPQQKAARDKLEAQKRQEDFREKQFNIKETKEYIKSLKDKEKASKESGLRLGRMEQLIKKGNLPNANFWTFLSKVEDTPLSGAGAGALAGSALGTAVLPGIGTAIGGALGGAAGGMLSPLAGAAKSWIKSGSPDVEEFEKLSNDFVKNAKQYFGPRLTDADLRVFMQTIPTLMQTDRGKQKVIENLRSLNELSEIEAKSARSIIKENGGIPPIDIEQQVQDKISHKIDKVAKKFLAR